MRGVHACHPVAHRHKAARFSVVLQSRHGQRHPHPREHGQRHAHQVGDQAGYAVPLRHPRGYPEQDGAADISKEWRS